MAAVETQDDQLARLVRNFDAWFDATRQARDEALSSRDYYDGYQWTDEELYAKYELSKSEIEFIEKVVRPMDLNQDSDDAEADD